MDRKSKLKRDLYIVGLSIVIGIVLLKTEVVLHLLTKSQELELLGIFISGIFFTSVFTTIPAMVALGELSLTNNLPELVVFGALGALCGDFLMFKFFRQDISADIRYLFKIKKHQRWPLVFKSKIFRFLMAFVGGLIIASPLPDELGLALMGFTRMNNFTFAIMSITFNSLGILAIAFVARGISAS